MTQPERVEVRQSRGLVGAPVRPRHTVKLRGVPKATATAARRKAGCSTRVMTSGMVKTQWMSQWVIRSQALRAPCPGQVRLRVQSND